MDIVTDQQRKKLHPHKFTLWVAIASILMMFAGLTSAFIVKSNQANWQGGRNAEVLLVFNRGDPAEQPGHTDGFKSFSATGDGQVQVADSNDAGTGSSFYRVSVAGVWRVVGSANHL